MVALLVEKSSNDSMLPGLNPAISGIWVKIVQNLEKPFGQRWWHCW
jgi:hypothetical protein